MNDEVVWTRVKCIPPEVSIDTGSVPPGFGQAFRLDMGHDQLNVH